MQQIPLSSSLIASAAYDEQAQQLIVVFKSGARWAYGDASQPFTPDDVAALEGASSKGQWLLQQIKGNWPERRA